MKLTPELRRRLPFLGHLPMHCDVTFLELDMVGFVSEGTSSKFKEGSWYGMVWYGGMVWPGMVMS